MGRGRERKEGKGREGEGEKEGKGAILCSQKNSLAYALWCRISTTSFLL